MPRAAALAARDVRLELAALRGAELAGQQAIEAQVGDTSLDAVRARG
jgi:hypothetical protein